jgi:hypothetical protein
MFQQLDAHHSLLGMCSVMPEDLLQQLLACAPIRVVVVTGIGCSWISAC